VQQFFECQVRPLLAPLGLDSSHRFPQVANKSRPMRAAEHA
jgi:polyphosphate kinase